MWTLSVSVCVGWNLAPWDWRGSYLVRALDANATDRKIKYFSGLNSVAAKKQIEVINIYFCG